MQPVRRTSLISQVTEQLRTEIAEGRWPVGSRIPTEPELAELTGTGRNTVREAVQALVHAGMVERRQGSGTFVLAASDLSGTLGRYFAGAQQRDVLELRHALDVTAATLAAERHDDRDAQVLTELLDARTAYWRASDRTAFVDCDVELHRAIVAASHNALYLEFYDSLVPAIKTMVHGHMDRSGQAYESEHAELVAAVLAGDGERAARVARCFLTRLLAEHRSPLGRPER